MYVSLIFMTTDIDRTLEDRIILQDYKKLKLVTQLCLTLCNTMDCSPPDFSVHGIIQARILEWITISSSRGSSWPRDWTHVSCIGSQILYHYATWEAHTQCWVHIISSSCVLIFPSCVFSNSTQHPLPILSCLWDIHLETSKLLSWGQLGRNDWESSVLSYSSVHLPPIFSCSFSLRCDDTVVERGPATYHFLTFA